MKRPKQEVPRADFRLYIFWEKKPSGFEVIHRLSRWTEGSSREEPNTFKSEKRQISLRLSNSIFHYMVLDGTNEKSRKFTAKEKQNNLKILTRVVLPIR